MSIERVFITAFLDRNVVQMGGIDHPDAEIQKIKDDIIVFKVPGHKYQYGYSSVHTVSYAAAEYQVWQFEKDVKWSDNLIEGWANKIITFPVRRAKDACFIEHTPGLLRTKEQTDKHDPDAYWDEIVVCSRSGENVKRKNAVNVCGTFTAITSLTDAEKKFLDIE